MAKERKKVTRKDVRDSLLMQLEVKGAGVAFYKDLVDKYMDLWDDIEAFRDDIRERGRRYEAVSASGKVYERENENVDRIPRHLKEMQSLLDKMKLSPDSIVLSEEDANDAL